RTRKAGRRDVNRRRRHLRHRRVETASSTGLAGRIMFGPDSTLYVAVGDRDLLFGSNDNSSRMRAQAMDTHIGKVLRIRDDGGVPADNPFLGKAGVKPEIFTY